MARTDIPHKEVASHILSTDCHDFGAIARLAAVKRLSNQDTTGFNHQYHQEAICRALCGAVAAYCRTHHPDVSIEDILTIATLIERQRTTAA